KGDTLYVADRRNHLVRALDLKKQTVKTVAGTGEKSDDPRERRRGGPALKINLNSPWDLWVDGDRLLIAMAGHHQLWAWALKTNELSPFAGAGPEMVIDGPLTRACFAQ